MNDPLIRFLDTTLESASTERFKDTGGKAASLQRLLAAGFTVPHAAVLTTAFFKAWYASLASDPNWNKVLAAKQDQRAEFASQLQQLAEALPLGLAQAEALATLQSRLAGASQHGLFAVRSSAGDEDGSDASFAGIYKTRLGVPLAQLEAAVRDCFVASLDARVWAYRHAQRLDQHTLALIVQPQLNSEVAGVGFSINPLTNDFDQALINANWGQGEAVVSGIVSPDQFVLSKLDHAVLQRDLGEKALVLEIDTDGGVRKKPRQRNNEFCLTDAQLEKISCALVDIEALYGQPVDIEWAFESDTLYLLQARPITRYVPLPQILKTARGERRRLYSDIALSSGLTINAPISPMGLDWMQQILRLMVDQTGVPRSEDLPIEHQPIHFAGGRMYQNLSAMFWLASARRQAVGMRQTDALMARILENVDEAAYKTRQRPSWARWRMLRYLPRVLWRLRRFVANTLWAMLAPERASRRYQQQLRGFQQWVRNELDTELSLEDFIERYSPIAFRHLIDETMTALAAGLGAAELLTRLLPKKLPNRTELAEQLQRGYPGNVVAEMGVALFDLAGPLGQAGLDSTEALASEMAHGDLPEAVMSAWHRFVRQYGWRGPAEMDLASPRYVDDPALLAQQLAAMSLAGQKHDPKTAMAQQQAEREDALRQVRQASGRVRRILIDHVNRVAMHFAGTRDTPKHQNLLYFQAVRQQLLKHGRRLVATGRLEAPEDIFGLTFTDLRQAQADPSLDLRSRRAQRMAFNNKLDQTVTTFPPVIDSRGRVLRPAAEPEVPGQLSGMPISPGVVRGPVKILHKPGQKPVEPGDILVAHTTDPGWTPLFIPAAAIVLEIGGTLQHGAVIAREYGKPCVAGISDLLSRLRDGMMVEVDGYQGTVQIIDHHSNKQTGNER